MPEYAFTVNGTPIRIEADPDTPLLFVLRDQLDLNGPRFGCGLEQCGACRVLVNDELAWSCTRPVESVQGSDVTTVEGLADGAELHPLQQAFLEFNAAQCGYCASGILMSAHALLKRNPSPTREEIQAGLAQNLCRCGAHNRIIRAVMHAARQMRAG